jgi:hypothetical protein
MMALVAQSGVIELVRRARTHEARARLAGCAISSPDCESIEIGKDRIHILVEKVDGISLGLETMPSD